MTAGTSNLAFGQATRDAHHAPAERFLPADRSTVESQRGDVGGNLNSDHTKVDTHADGVAAEVVLAPGQEATATHGVSAGRVLAADHQRLAALALRVGGTYLDGWLVLPATKGKSYRLEELALAGEL
jgi:hypothetical protein